MAKDGLNRDILSLAGPSILANITVPIVGMVDIAVAGHMPLGEAATLIGGISIGTMLFDLLYWNFGFLRVGTGGLTAQAYGRGDRAEMASTLCRGVGLSMVIAAVILILQVPFVKLAMLMVDSSEEVRSLALEYFHIRVWAAPATLSLMAIKGWFIGMQDTVSSMFTDLVVNGVNIAGSIILALGVGSFEGLGFPGISLGTVIAQYSGLLFAFVVIAFKYGRDIFPGYTPAKIVSSFSGGQIGRFFVVNTDLFIRSICLVAVYVGFTSISAKFGDLLLSTGAIMMKLLLLFSYFTDGFAFAGEALVGKYIGMKDIHSTRRTVGKVFIWSMSIGMSFILIYLLCGTPIVKVLTSDADVVESCRQFFVWLLPMPLIGCAAFTWDGIYVGATASKEMRDSTIWCMVGFFASWFIMDAIFGGPDADPAFRLNLLLGAYFVHLFIRALYQTVLYNKAILRRPFEV